MKITKLAEIPATVAQQAWALSRDPTYTTPLNEVLAVDAPVNELPSVVLHFQNFTILEREIFTSPRNHVIWARTSRVDDPLRFTVPEEYISQIPTERIRHLMRNAKNLGKPQDEWRSMLPLLAHTNWVGRLSLRDTAKLADYFLYLASRIKMFHDRWLNIHSQLFEQIPHVEYKPEKFLNEQPLNQASGRQKFGTGWTLFYAAVPMMLRAQVVRHRPIHFIDNLFYLLKDEKIILQNLNQIVHMELCAPDTFWHSIMAKRNCWIAQADIWHALTVYFDQETLPCIDGHCPYSVDNELRKQGKDPNVVCPIYMHLTNQDATSHKAAMRAHARSKPKWWLEKIESC
jgi:hypothetical protein